MSKTRSWLLLVKPFIHALIEEMKDALDISNLPVLNAFLKLDTQGLPDRDSLSFESYSKEELEVLHDFYYSKKEWCKLTHFMTHSFHLYYWNWEILRVMSPSKKIALSPEYTGKEKSLSQDLS